MTPRQLREQIEGIDQRLKALGPWEKQLVAMRRRHLVEDTDNARWAIDIIDNGLRAGQGRPNDPDFAPFDDGLPGLHRTRDTIAGLKERRALLIEQQPSKAQTDAKKKEAGTRAADIRARAEALAASIAPLEAALNETARLALAVAEESHRLWEENSRLDRLAAENDIARPSTPRVEAPTLRTATALSALLGRHFRGGQPYPVDLNAARQMRNALREPEPELAAK